MKKISLTDAAKYIYQTLWRASIRTLPKNGDGSMCSPRPADRLIHAAERNAGITFRRTQFKRRLRRPSEKQGFPSMEVVTPYDTVSRLICLRMATTFAQSRNCWVTKT